MPKNLLPRFGSKQTKLEYELGEILSSQCGRRGDNEGAVETLCRIIHERDAAMEKLALIAIQPRFIIRSM